MGTVFDLYAVLPTVPYGLKLMFGCNSYICHIKNNVIPCYPNSCTEFLEMFPLSQDRCR